MASLAYSRVKCIEKNLLPSVNNVSDPRRSGPCHNISSCGRLISAGTVKPFAALRFAAANDPRMDYRLAGPQMGSDEVCRDEELSHDRCDGDFAGLAGANELIVFRLEIRVVAGCDQSGHVNGSPQKCSATLDALFALPLTRLPRDRS